MSFEKTICRAPNAQSTAYLLTLWLLSNFNISPQEVSLVLIFLLSHQALVAVLMLMSMLG